MSSSTGMLGSGASESDVDAGYFATESRAGLLGRSPSVASLVEDEHGPDVAAWVQTLRPLTPWHPDDDAQPPEVGREPGRPAGAAESSAAGAARREVAQVPFAGFRAQPAEVSPPRSTPDTRAFAEDAFADFDDVPAPPRASAAGQPSSPPASLDPGQRLAQHRATLVPLLRDAEATGELRGRSPGDRELQAKPRSIPVYAKRALRGLRDPRAQETEAPTRPPSPTRGAGGAASAAGTPGRPVFRAAEAALLDRVMWACTGAAAPRDRHAWGTEEARTLAREGGRLLETCLRRGDTDSAARLAGLLLLPSLAAEGRFQDASRLRERLAVAQPEPRGDAAAALEIGLATLDAAQGYPDVARSRIHRATTSAALDGIGDLRLRTHALRTRLALGGLDDRGATGTRLRLASELTRLGHVNDARVEVTRAARSVVTHGYADESLRCLEVEANIAEFEGRRRPRPGETVQLSHAALGRAVRLLSLYRNRCESLFGNTPQRLWPMLSQVDRRLQTLRRSLSGAAYGASADAATRQDAQGNRMPELGTAELLHWASEAPRDDAAG